MLILLTTDAKQSSPNMNHVSAGAKCRHVRAVSHERSYVYPSICLAACLSLAGWLAGWLADDSTLLNERVSELSWVAYGRLL
jgi:hypothetical protein